METRDWRRSPGLRRPRTRLGWLLITAGLGLIPWLTALVTMLPATALAYHWGDAWAGLDVLESAGLLATGVAMIRHDRRLCLAAAVTAALLAADAWLDVATAAPGPAQAIALAMALGAELPCSALCGYVALRTLPR
jgi:hypothetical protein